MRVLFSTTAGAGHFGPLVPFAHACRDAGHDVRVAAPTSFAASVAAAGLDHAPFDDVAPEVMGAVFARLPRLSTDEANAVVIGEVFGRLDAQAAFPGVAATIASWRPHVVVREFCEFGSWAAAEAAGVPQVVVEIGLREVGEMALTHLVTPLGELRAVAGLPADPDLDTLRTAPSFTTVPTTLDGPDPPNRPPPARFRDPSALASEIRLPAPWGDADAPLVYVTFGSVAATAGPFAAVYPAVRDALADAPVRVLLTTGDGLDPAALAPWPANLHVERWWPQAEVMPAAAAIVGHGGFGTTMVAAAAGLPQVVLPLFAADQFANARRIADIGAGICVDGAVDGVAELPPALEAVLADPSYRAIAQEVAAEIASRPDVSTAVPIFEQMGRR
jgi:UDP:flavonoid glycosyltransferase YjiC (YdhE family)